MASRKPLEEGHWVKWYTSDGFLMFGKVLGQPDLNRKYKFIVPVETLNGTKTVVLEDNLEIIPHQPKGKMTDKKKQELIEAMSKHNKSRNGKQIMPGTGTPVDLEALVKAREAELEEKESKLQVALTNAEKLTEENSRLKSDLELKEAEIDQLRLDIKNNESFVRYNDSVLDDIKESVSTLKELVNTLILSADDSSKPSLPFVATELLPVVYRLIKHT